MSSLSAQGVVERASAELSKRINGLGLRTGKHNGQAQPPNGKLNQKAKQKTLKKFKKIKFLVAAPKTVMERVTNVLCGGNAAPPAPLITPDKPYRYQSSRHHHQHNHHHQTLATPAVPEKVSFHLSPATVTLTKSQFFLFLRPLLPASSPHRKRPANLRATNRVRPRNVI